MDSPTQRSGLQPLLFGAILGVALGAAYFASTTPEGLGMFGAEVQTSASQEFYCCNHESVCVSTSVGPCTGETFTDSKCGGTCYASSASSAQPCQAVGGAGSDLCAGDCPNSGEFCTAQFDPALGRLDCKCMGSSSSSSSSRRACGEIGVNEQCSLGGCSSGETCVLNSTDPEASWCECQPTTALCCDRATMMCKQK